MPSTFTTNTGIEKIADGEQSGLWGQTTNLNFDIVDRALNGSVPIALSGTTHTLTTSNGVLSDGQFAVLVFTGSPSGTNTVTIAPNTAQKLYWVRNTTAQNVTLSQGSGGTVAVAPSTTKIVYTSGGGAGASVVDLTATLAGGFIGNVTGNASTATALQTARTIGGVSFDGTANINLPGVNQAGNQNTSGNAATATVAATWTTARTLTINGVGKSVNGSADVAWTGAEVGSVPSGGIIMWSGAIANIPAGWLLCDGSNGTPDLRDRFVVGAGSSYAVGNTGGANTVALTTSEMPAHTHSVSGSTNTTGEHTHPATFGANIGGNTFFFEGRINALSTITNGIGSAGAHSHTISGTAASAGGGGAHENRPPYYALAYIMKA